MSLTLTEPTSRTLAQLAQEALDVQDACNLSGVAQGFGRAMVDLRRALNDGHAIRTHAITVLWLDKLADMTNRNADYGSAYAECLTLTERGR